VIVLKAPHELAIMREANLHVYEILNLLEQAAQPGTSTAELDRIAEDELKKRNLKSPFLGYASPPYPAVLCTSINDVVVHGIPSKSVKLKDGDIIGIDFGVIHRGYVGDSARTVMVGKVAPEFVKLVEVARESLERGIRACVVGARVRDIGQAIESYVTPFGYAMVRDFVGHGVGTKMHEEPQVPNYYARDATARLKPGLVIAIEPMVNIGTHEVRTLADGWTAVTADHKRSAHFEHSVAITESGPVVLSRP
jgi:methionyl aminopeptidase